MGVGRKKFGKIVEGVCDNYGENSEFFEALWEVPCSGLGSLGVPVC